MVSYGIYKALLHQQIITGNMTYGSYLHVFLQKIIMWGSKGDSVIMSVPQTDVSHFSGKL